MNESAARPRSTAIKLLMLLVGFTALDVCGGFLATVTELAYFLLIPVLAAQFALAAAWAVLAPRPLIERTVTSVLAATWWVGAGVLPMALIDPPEERFTRIWWSLLPSTLLALQVPLWTCRVTFGWHVVRGAEPRSVVPTKRQFGMRHLLSAITTVAIWLGILRLSMAIISPFRGFDGEPVALMLSMILQVVPALWLGLLMVLCLYVALGARLAIEASLVLAWAVGSLSLIVAGVGGVFGGVAAFLSVAVHVIFLAAFHGTLLAARRDGFVLRWVTRRAQADRP